MQYRYRCGQCRTTSHPVATRRAAHREGAWHRARVHAGHHPDGELIEPAHDEQGHGAGTVLALLLLGCLLFAACARLTP